MGAKDMIDNLLLGTAGGIIANILTQSSYRRKITLPLLTVAIILLILILEKVH
jgi:hypothetical protein